MRFVAVLFPLALLAGCGAKYKPTGPVLSDYERTFKYPVHRPHEGLFYSGREAAIQAPVLPVMAFGAAFDLDFAVMPREGDFQMLEFARVSLPDRHLWLALETSRASGDQTLLANLDDIQAFMPEIPLRRQSVNMTAEDRSTEFTVDLSINYTNSQGEEVRAELTGDPPTKTQDKRNGRTFDHSQNQLMAVLDVPAVESLFKADVQVDGKGLGFKKIGGIVPGQWALTQTQGGFAVANFKIVPGEPASGSSAYGEVAVHAPSSTGQPAETETKPPPDMLARMVVAKNFNSIQQCWTDRSTAAAEAKSELKGGRMQFTWTVKDGAVTDVKSDTIETEDTLEDEALRKCVVLAIQGWKYDETVSGSGTWPFTFVPGSEVEATDPTVRIEEGAFTLDETAPAPAPEAAAPEAAPAPGTEGAPAPAPGAELPEEGGESEDPDAAPATPDPGTTAPLNSFTSIHTGADGTKVEMKWLVSQYGDRVLARQSSDLRTLEYEYRLVQGNYLELVGITVEQYGRATPVTAITFNPPIPDLRWPFNGRRNSAFVIDVNGQQSYATGEVEAYWTESGPKVKIAATEPEWAAARPMLTTITYGGDGTADVKIERTGE